jgi:D-alanyl-D-alanine carboxypeptidase
VRQVGITTLTLIAVVLAGSLTTSGGRAATPSSADRHSLDALVVAGSPGALVLVDRSGSRRQEAAGLAVLRGSVPLRAGDRFRAGSITKTFVAVVVLQLVAEKKLGLGDTVGRWLPGLVPNGDRITVRQLLAHTSGLADYAGDSAFLHRTVSEPRRRWKPRELVGVALAQGSVGRPGERFAYASTNYVLLGLVVERATGATLERQLRSRIFTPLGLRSTSFSSGTRIPGRHAHGYAPSQHDGIIGSLATARDRSTASASWGWAAGAIVSTAPDLSRFFGTLLQGRLLPARLLTLMRPPQGARYGLGLAAFRTPCGTAIGHTGNLLGTVSAVWSSRDGRRRVVAMTNSYPLSPAADTAFRRLMETAYCGA